MQTWQKVTLGLGTFAIFYVITKPESFQSQDFTKGYAAGFFTPGPFTILGLLGVGLYAVSL